MTNTFIIHLLKLVITDVEVLKFGKFKCRHVCDFVVANIKPLKIREEFFCTEHIQCLNFVLGEIQIN